MAGIGFRLKTLLHSEDLYKRLGGAFASVLLSSGPWICSILSIASISYLIPKWADPRDREVFRVIINYTYVASLVGFSVIEMVTTRYLADAIYIRQERVVPTLFRRLALATMIYGTALGLTFYSFTHLDWRTVLLAAVLLSAVTLTWCSMIFLSACKDYVSISLAFVGGLVGGVAASHFFGGVLKLGIDGYLLGFTLGQVVVAGTLSFRIFREFGTETLAPRDYPAFVAKHRTLVVVGMAYALAIWVDKVIFWLSPRTSEQVAPLFYKSSAYDAGMFLAYLFVVPAMAYFLVQIETRFYLAYRRYFIAIDSKAPLASIERARLALLKILQEESSALLGWQALLVIPFLLVAPRFVMWVGLPATYSSVFRFGLIGASLHVFMLFTNILILYFDLPKKAALNYLLFFVLNALFAFITAGLNPRFHGLGYPVAALIGLVVSLYSLSRILDDLHYHVFSKQPFGTPASRPFATDVVVLS